MPALAPEFAGPERFENKCDRLPVLEALERFETCVHAVGDGLVYLRLELAIGRHLAANRLEIDLDIIGDIGQRHAQLQSINDAGADRFVY